MLYMMIYDGVYIYIYVIYDDIWFVVLHPMIHGHLRHPLNPQWLDEMMTIHPPRI